MNERIDTDPLAFPSSTFNAWLRYRVLRVATKFLDDRFPPRGHEPGSSEFHRSEWMRKNRGTVATRRVDPIDSRECDTSPINPCSRIGGRERSKDCSSTDRERRLSIGRLSVIAIEARGILRDAYAEAEETIGRPASDPSEIPRPKDAARAEG